MFPKKNFLNHFMMIELGHFLMFCPIFQISFYVSIKTHHSNCLHRAHCQFSHVAGKWDMTMIEARFLDRCEACYGWKPTTITPGSEKTGWVQDTITKSFIVRGRETSLKFLKWRDHTKEKRKTDLGYKTGMGQNSEEGIRKQRVSKRDSSFFRKTTEMWKNFFLYV